MTKKKKTLIIVLSIVAAIAIAVGVTLAVLLTRKPETPPSAGDSTIYQTKSESFWSGFGSAYMTFDYIAEPEQKEEGKLYGYVFNVKVKNEGEWQSWLSGKWEMNSDETELTLTASWDNDDMSLRGATSGQPKTYTLSNGVFKISVNLPSASDTVFTLNPKTDKVGESSTPTPPCTEHVDTNPKDGKCDKCGADMPGQGEATVQATLSAEVSTIKAKIELKNNNTWTLSMCYYGDAYTPSADGRWSMNTTTYAITLVVENDEANMLAEDFYDLAINYETQKYSATIAITMPSEVPTIGGQALDFAFEQEAEAPVQKEVQKMLNADNGAQKAKIELYKDNTWEVSICFYGDSYSPMASGTWELNTTTYNILLTVTGDEADVLAEDTYTLNVDIQSHEYSTDMTLTVPQVGALTFDFNSAVVAQTHYTVTYDLNYAGAPAGGTAETKTIKLNDANKEYLDTAPAIPTREGYKFAGWYTVANPVLSNGASDKEYLFGTKLETTYNAPPAHLQNEVMEITSDTTLYARWVEVKEISTAAQLKDMANDLTGWYKLTADITLTEEWMPVGLYYVWLRNAFYVAISMENTSDLTTNFVYMECPTCGKYILHDKSRYLYNSMATTTVKDNIKAREFLFYHKKDQLTYFLGSQEEYKDFKLTFPQDDARLVTQQQIENWYPYKLSQIFDFAIQYFNAQQEYFGQRMQYSLYQLRSIYFIDANNVQLEDEIKAPFSEQIFYITNCLNEMGLLTSSSIVSAVGHCPWSKSLSIILTPKGIEKATQLQSSQNRDVFVAMSFHKSADDIRKAIKQGIEDAQYSSLLMDEIVHNHQIVPEMLRLIKETRFMIMDITQPNFGAYYEAGYAQGLEKEVIITCSKEVWDKKDFSCDLDKDCRYKEIASKPHFDIAQKQVLVWKDYKDLTKQLTEWIKHIIG